MISFLVSMLNIGLFLQAARLIAAVAENGLAGKLSEDSLVFCPDSRYMDSMQDSVGFMHCLDCLPVFLFAGKYFS